MFSHNFRPPMTLKVSRRAGTRSQRVCVRRSTSRRGAALLGHAITLTIVVVIAVTAMLQLGPMVSNNFDVFSGALRMFDDSETGMDPPIRIQVKETDGVRGGVQPSGGGY